MSEVEGGIWSPIDIDNYVLVVIVILVINTSSSHSNTQYIVAPEAQSVISFGRGPR